MTEKPCLIITMALAHAQGHRGFEQRARQSAALEDALAAASKAAKQAQRERDSGAAPSSSSQQRHDRARCHWNCKNNV